MKDNREDETHMFRVEHTGGMSLGIPILRNYNITFAKFTLDKFSYTSQYYKLPSHEMTRVSVITSNLKRGWERSRPPRRHPGNVRYQRQKVTRISPTPEITDQCLLVQILVFPRGEEKPRGNLPNTTIWILNANEPTAALIILSS